MKNLIYQEKVINLKIKSLENCLSQIEYLNIKLDHREQEEGQNIKKQIRDKHFNFNSSLAELYLTLVNYFETQNSKELLSLFKTELCHVLEDDYNGLLGLEHPETGQIIYFSEDLSKIKKYLISFEGFDQNSDKYIGLKYLENILKHTSYIIKELKIKPTNETSVYNSVKHVIKATFPEYVGLSEPFYKEAKCYKPDILIPYLNSAVEYKYATDEQRLIKSIEDILIDVAGYSNHYVYKIFYAVFYVTPGICSEQRFNNLWNSYDFPENWKPIYVIGE